MSIQLRIDEKQKINLSPQTVQEEVMQNICTIVNVVRGSCPFMRYFGLDGEFTDKPVNVAETIFASEIYEAIEEFEPRAEIVDIDFENCDKLTGRMIPVLEVNINAE